MILTPAAVAAAKKKLENDLHGALRVGLSGSGGCEGMTLVLSYEDGDPFDNDTEFLFSGLKVIVDAKSLVYLKDATIDYEKTLMKEGFVLKSDKIQSTCGCGKSFVITKE